MTKVPKAHYDSPWKEAVSLHFQSFLDFFFPRIWTDIDWTRGYRMLDQELQKIVPDATVGQLEADALVQVTRRSGGEQWVLIHVEVQSQATPDFGRRMASYHARIRLRYNRDVCSLAILGDEVSAWRPRTHSSELWGCRQKLWFPIKKLLDFPKSATRPGNPFSWLVAAHRQSQATSSIERIGVEKGRAEGIAEGSRKASGDRFSRCSNHVGA
jgi:hypothetical protein